MDEVITITNDIPLTKTYETEGNEENSPDINTPIQSNASEEEGCLNTNYDPKNVHYEGETAIYTDPISKYQYKWNNEENEWTHYTNVNCEYGFEDDTHTYTDSEGIKYFWDKEKKAWFPKINDDFMAQYQLNYGFIDNIQSQPKTLQIKTGDHEPIPKKSAILPNQKRKASEPSWFNMDEGKNTKVYVSNLPLDINEEEFGELMQKYGIIMKDTNTNQPKIKLYRDSETNDIKGDGLCTYIKRESVDLALNLLDGLEYKGKSIRVELATFQMKGTYDPKLKPKTKKRKEKEKLKRQQEKLFDWRPEKQLGDRGKHERCVILKNVFESEMFDDNVGLILTLQDELRQLACKYGEVKKVVIYDRHPEGVAQINMKEPDDADQAVVNLSNMLYRGRRITAEIWDGRTKFKIAETDSEINQRLEKWDKFLESENSNQKEIDLQKKDANEVDNDRE